MASKSRMGLFLFLLPTLAVFLVFYLVPMAFVFLVSLSKWDGLAPFRLAGLVNYVRVFKDPATVMAFTNSFYWILMVLLVQIPLGLLVAVILSTRPRAWRIMRTVFFLPNIISSVALALMWYFIYDGSYGLLNAFLAAVGLQSWQRNWLGDFQTALPAVMASSMFYIGFFMVVYMARIATISVEIYESARLDGATLIQESRYITIPIIKDTVAITAILGISGSLKFFDYVFVMTNGGPGSATEFPLTLLYRYYMHVHDYGFANAIATVVLGVGVLCLLVFRWAGRTLEISE